MLERDEYLVREREEYLVREREEYLVRKRRNIHCGRGRYTASGEVNVGGIACD